MTKQNDNKAQMDRIIDAMMHAPDSFDTVLAYGQPSLKKLGDIANEMLKLQNSFNKLLSAGTDNLQLGLPSLIKAVEKVDLERVEATREIGNYLGAAQEILKRNIIVQHKNDFIDRITVLESSRAQSVIMAQQLHLVVDAMKDLIKTPAQSKKKPGGKFNP